LKTVGEGLCNKDKIGRESDIEKGWEGGRKMAGSRDISNVPWVEEKKGGGGELEEGGEAYVSP